MRGNVGAKRHEPSTGQTFDQVVGARRFNAYDVGGSSSEGRGSAWKRDACRETSHLRDGGLGCHMVVLAN